MTASSAATPGPLAGGTVAGIARQHAATRPDELAYSFLPGRGRDSHSYTWAELDTRARAVAAALRDAGLRGRPVLLLHQPGLEYVSCFLGCLYAGAIAVPAYPPDTRRFGQSAGRLAAIVADSRCTVALTTDTVRRAAEEAGHQLADLGLGGLSWVATDTIADADSAGWQPAVPEPDTLALLQYTSGSTSTPKGVMVSNANLVANLRSIHRRLEHDRDSAMVSWLPPFHDMGLIGGILSPLYGGFPAYLMAPETFIATPLLWLETLSRTAASTSVAPNFGFEHCLRRVAPEDRAGLDLSNWRLALDGAEPVRAATLARFAAYFAPCGFDSRALLPCYGLAEATLMVTGVAARQRPTVAGVDSAALADGSARPGSPSGGPVTRVVGCGTAVDDTTVAVVDAAAARRVPDGRVGEVWVRGPGVARGYWRRPAETQETFRAGLDGTTSWLRTGDLGFLRDGELHVVGRSKDVVIVAGRNLYPHDIELTVEQSSDAIRPGAGAAFGIEVDGGEQLVVAYEVDQHRITDPGAVLAAVRSAVAQQHEVTPHAVVLLRRSSVPKTTSGKIQRQACREAFLRLGLSVVAASVADGPVAAPPDRRSSGPAREAVLRVLSELSGSAAPAGQLAGLGIDYPRLLGAAGTLESELGRRLPIGAVLVAPEVDTLVTLLGDKEAEPAVGPTAADVEQWLTAMVAARLGLLATAIDRTAPFASLGLDSKQSVAIADELGRRLGRSLDPGIVFEHPTIRAVAAAVTTTGPLGQAPPDRTRERAGREEPIAIVGIGCRFPGAAGAESFWKLLRDGRDATGPVPADRWDPGRVEAPTVGGFIDGVDSFDARLFGISAREAERMDPQQRLLLETACQALDDAGIAATSLAGTDTGVFVGIGSSDYAGLTLTDADTADVHDATGNSHSLTANRVSYFLDLHGPSLAVDTACSSALVAVHLACRSMRDGDCTAAIAGGVNLMLTPVVSAAFAKAGMLSPEGRCRPFDSAADGYVRGEGAGVVYLKPLSAAVAAGDRVYAVIRGSAVGHGGRSNGITAPRGAAQRAVMSRALDTAGVPAGEVDYVEAHGTGTTLGDPVEWESLAAVYGQARRRPCLVGSVKSTIGHLEAAAGVAGLIKAALVLQHREVPAQLNLTVPNSRLRTDGVALALATRSNTLPTSGTVHAGVSSFGFGGANAHVVLESAPPVAPPPQGRPEPSHHALCLSGHTPSALATLVHRYRLHLAAHPDDRIGDLCHTANSGRSHREHRAVVVAADMAALDAGLASLEDDRPDPAVARGDAPGGRTPAVAFLFSGQGTQHPGMGRALYESHAGVAESLDRADAVLRPLLDRPLLDLLFHTDGEKLRRTRHSQPALVALEIALTDLWTSLGIRPAAVLGHSVGAYAAAYAAGVLSAEDALRLAAVRGQHMDQQPGDGAMLACAGDPASVRAAAASYSLLSVAAVNAAEHLVLSGPRRDIEAVAADLAGRGVGTRPLPVSHAFHSPLMSGAAGPLRAAARAVPHGPATLPWVSDATGAVVGRVDADYWVGHMLGTVRFADGMATLLRQGCDTFVEIGPHPALLGLGRRVALEQDAQPDLRWLPSARRDADGWHTLLHSVGQLHLAGASVIWSALDAGRRRTRVRVPSTVFERQSYWSPVARSRSDATGGRAPVPVIPVAPADPVTAVSRVAPVVGGEQSGAAGPDETVAATVLRHVGRVSGFPPEQIPLRARLGVDLGFDSLMKTELHRTLTQVFPGTDADLRDGLPDDPSVEELVALLPQACPDALPVVPAEPVIRATPVVTRERCFEDWAEYAELQERLRLAESSGTNPYGRVHEGFNSGTTTVNGRSVLNFAAFNYLGLSDHPRVRSAAKAAIDRYGTSSSATPLLCGETPLHHELDAEIASFLGTEDAIVFAGGHATNVATVGHLFGAEDLILHDQWIHDSSVRGAILSGARRRPFRHNDWQALDDVLTTVRDQYRRVLVLIEGGYSQDGDLPDLPEFIRVKKKHDAMLMIDEAHSIGVLGRTGRGVGEHFDVDRSDVDLWMGTLSKALGSLGGYISGRRTLIEYLKFTTPLYIFSTGISPANAGAALEALRVVQDEPERVSRLQSLADRFRTGARDRGLDIGVSRASAVIPVILGDWDRTMRISNELLRLGLNVMPIGYPAVDKDKCRLRFFVNADHSEDDLDHALDLLGTAMTNIDRDRRPLEFSGPEPIESTRDSADVLVAGATGFIGSHLTRRLVEAGHRVRALVRPGSDRAAISDLGVDVVTGDLTDGTGLDAAMAGIRHVYNCTGKSADWGPWPEFRAVNVDGPRRLVEAAHRAGTVERVVHLSTTDVYGYPVRPCDETGELVDVGLPYNRSKILGERAVRDAAARTGLPLTVVRPVSVYGPRSKDFVVEIATLLLKRQMVYIGGGDVPAGLIYVDNLVDGLIAACESDTAAGRTYNLRDSDLTTWREYVEGLARGLGVRPPSVNLPSPVATGVARTSEFLWSALRIKSRPVLTRHAVRLFDRDQSYGIDRAQDDFGFKSAVSLEDGLRMTLDWLRSAEGAEAVPAVATAKRMA